MTKNYLLAISLCGLMLTGLAPEPKTVEGIFLRLFCLLGFVSSGYVLMRHVYLKYYARRLRSAFNGHREHMLQIREERNQQLRTSKYGN